jgi:hypothetical protein
MSSSSGSSENGDYVSRDDEESEKRYPLHDCCEFEDIEALKVRLLAVAVCIRVWLMAAGTGLRLISAVLLKTERPSSC